MTIVDKIIALYPELSDMSKFMDGTIWLQNDMDGRGDYIAHWGYDKPEPTPEQLA